MNEPAALDPIALEAMRKTDIAWITVDGGPARALWCLWANDALHVVCGPREQPDPGLAETDTCRLTLRGDHNGRILDSTARVTALRPESSEWHEAAEALVSKRLNASGADTISRWASEASIYRLEPVAGEAEHGDQLPTGSLAAAPPPSPAARPARPPYRLHRIRRRLPAAAHTPSRRPSTSGYGNRLHQPASTRATSPPTAPSRR